MCFRRELQKENWLSSINDFQNASWDILLAQLSEHHLTLRLNDM